MTPISLKIDDKHFKLLDQVSKATHIPKSALIRKGIEMVLSQTKEDITSLELRQEITALLNEDRELLKRLAKA